MPLTPQPYGDNSDSEYHSESFMDPEAQSNDEDEEWFPHGSRKQDSIYTFAKSTCKKTRQTTGSTPLIEHTDDLLLSDKRGALFFSNATAIATYLRICKSDVGLNAGRGLFLVAESAPLYFKRGQLITWFKGKIVFANRKDPEQRRLKYYSIGLGCSFSNAAQMILSDPKDDSLLGCGHFINHSKMANCKLNYIRGQFGIIGTVIELKNDIVLQRGEAIELVFNSGQKHV